MPVAEPARVWTLDLAAFVALLALLATFGRPFAKLSVPGAPIYVTEVALVLIAALAIARVGFRGSVERLRRVLPLVALAVFFLAGFIAAARGVARDPGAILPDIGLLVYAAFVPLAAVIVDSRERALAIVRALALAGAAAIAMYVATRLAPSQLLADNWPSPPSAAGLYFALWIVWVGARMVHGLQVRPIEYVAAGVGLTALSLLVHRSAWLAMIVAAAVLVAFAPRRRPRWALVAIVAFVASNICAYLVTPVVSDDRHVSLPSARMDPAFAAHDDGRPFGGGARTEDAADGSAAREVARGQLLQVSALQGLEPGRLYTVAFLVKPVGGGLTEGRVGDTSGGGWGQARWFAAGERWQRVEVALRARRAAERLVFAPVRGAARVRFDRVTVAPDAPSPGARNLRETDAIADPDLRIDDDPRDGRVSGAYGADVVYGDIPGGGVGRLLYRGEPHGLDRVRGLDPGSVYTIQAWVKSSGRGGALIAGDTAGVGWGDTSVTLPRTRKWSRVSLRLRATRRGERLVFAVSRTGAEPVTLAGVRLRKGAIEAAGARSPAPAGGGGSSAPADDGAPDAAPPAPAPSGDATGGGPQILTEIRGTVDPSVGGEANPNARWRLAIWRHVAGETLKQPLFGVGFSTPTAFEWEGTLYDARRGEATNVYDEIAPHNSLLNVAFRMGLLGAVALFALIGTAVVRSVRALRSARTTTRDRAVITALLAQFAFAFVIASFNVALEGPYMAVFFWVLIALLLVVPRLVGGDASEGGNHQAKPAQHGRNGTAGARSRRPAQPSHARPPAVPRA